MMQKPMFRIRLGIILFIISWLPFEPLIVIWAHHHNVANGWRLSTIAIGILWIIQFIIGLIGIYFVGRAVMKESRRFGYKRAITNIWHIFLHGESKTT
jgi:hypothetical protein